MAFLGMLLAIGSMAAVAGCGGDSSSATGSSTGEKSKHLLSGPYVAEANAICSVESGRARSTAEAFDEYEAVGRKLGKGGAMGRGEAVLPVLQRTIDRVAHHVVKAPAEHKAEVYAFLLRFQDVVQASTGNPVESIGELEARFGRSAELARELGIGECALG